MWKVSRSAGIVKGQVTLGLIKLTTQVSNKGKYKFYKCSCICWVLQILGYRLEYCNPLYMKVHLKDNLDASTTAVLTQLVWASGLLPNSVQGSGFAL